MLKIEIKYTTEMEKNLGLDILSFAGCNEIHEKGCKLIGYTDVAKEQYKIIDDYIFRRTYGSMKVNVSEVD